MSSNPGTLTVYDLQGTQIAQVDPPAGVESYYPDFHAGRWTDFVDHWL